MHKAKLILPNVGKLILDHETALCCALPGGTPWLMLSTIGQRIPIDGAPRCDGLRDLEAFARERFGDGVEGRTNH